MVSVKMWTALMGSWSEGCFFCAGDAPDRSALALPSPLAKNPGVARPPGIGRKHMNALLFIRNGFFASLAVLGALAAGAQEQWLEYHTSREPRGYKWIELTTNAPANVALPKLRPFVYFGQWKNGLDGARWFALDRATRGGLCDRIFFDTNGNGRLDDESPIGINRREDMMGYFPPIKLTFKGEDGPTTYHLIMQLYQFDSDRVQLLVGAGGWYEGTVNLAGKKRRVQLFDNTVNGTFNDHGVGASECDRLVLPGAKPVERYLGQYLELDGQLLRIEVARDGAFIKAQKAEGVEFGQVRVPEGIAEFQAIGECGHFIRKPEKGEFKLPVGKYRVHSWTMNRKDNKEIAWTLSGSGFNRAANFEVAAGKPVVLEIGEPVRPLLEAAETRGQVSFSLRLLGSLGESVEIMRGQERPRAPQLQVASQAGPFRSTNTFEYG